MDWTPSAFRTLGAAAMMAAFSWQSPAVAIDVSPPAGMLRSDKIAEGRMTVSVRLRDLLRTLAQRPRDSKALAALKPLLAAGGMPVSDPPGILSVDVAADLLSRFDDPALQAVDVWLDFLGGLHVEQ
ncbi:MAG: hypothetical protein COW30_13015 [Rhodospirillales bacterium CG15_BIG_FIL_POST_REV_8_21_14_020_66_15]|nr:MAG: hypothetical protein COW30_13015 [Rhodospirillales bacterium CG15_BIG_FIL_POST_REV_8_21_14_020_66_15]